MSPTVPHFTPVHRNDRLRPFETDRERCKAEGLDWETVRIPALTTPCDTNLWGQDRLHETLGFRPLSASFGGAVGPDFDCHSYGVLPRDISLAKGTEYVQRRGRGGVISLTRDPPLMTDSGTGPSDNGLRRSWVGSFCPFTQAFCLHSKRYLLVPSRHVNWERHILCPYREMFPDLKSKMINRLITTINLTGVNL